MSSSDLTSSGVTRRTVMKGVAWSVPVVAAVTVAPMAAASTASSDLTPIFDGTQVLSLSAGPLAIANLTLANQLIIRNIGSSPSDTNVTVTVTLDANIASAILLTGGAGVINVSGAGTNTRLITIGPLAANGGQAVVDIGLVALPIGSTILPGDNQMTATIPAVDAVTTNNQAVSNVGVTLL
jgi:hypothetical protein